MNLLDLLQQIRTKSLNSFYIFTGEENTIRTIYTDQMLKAIDGTKVVLDSVLDVFSMTKAKSLIRTNKLYIVYNDKSFISDFNKYQEVLNSLGNDVLIVIVDKLDKRGKFYTENKERIVEFEKLSESQLVNYLQKSSELSTRYAQILAQMCDNSYGRAMLELDKVKHFATIRDITHDTALRELIEDNAIQDTIVDNNIAFSFSNAVINRERKKSLELLKECRDTTVNSLMLIALLYSSFKTTLQVQTYKGDNLEKATGISNKQAFVVRKRCGKYSVSELLNALDLIRKTETGIKNGKIDENVSLEILLVNIL